MDNAAPSMARFWPMGLLATLLLAAATVSVVIAFGTASDPGITAALGAWRDHPRFPVTAVAVATPAIAAILIVTRQLWRGHRWAHQRLALQTLRLNTAVNNMPQGLLMFDADARLALCNERYLQMYRLSPDIVRPGCTLFDLIRHRKDVQSLPGDPQEYYAAILADLAKGNRTSRSVETAHGKIIQVVNEPMANGGWVATHEDVTDRRRAERERDRSQAFLSTVLDNVPSPIFVKDAAERRYVLVNRAGEQLWGHSSADIIGKTAHDLFPGATADLIADHESRLLRADGVACLDEHAILAEQTIDTPGCGVRFVTTKRIVIRGDDDQPQYLLGVIDDITERKSSDERIAHLAHYDALTDLPNRALFRQQLEQALKWVDRGQRSAVLYLDLDHFKGVNDTLGHPVGDELLKAVAARLRGCLRQTDVVARLGGDEFAIIQTNVTQPADVIDLVNRIHQAIRQPYEAGGHQLIADTSIGIAVAPDDGMDPDQLLKNADLALYGAKLHGRGTYHFFEPAMDARVKARRALELELREAIMCGGFELHYQPVVDLRGNHITGCEGLLRWHHPERGMIPPVEFISIAEETGLITPLGEWVLRTACAEAATWPDDIKIAVNVSPVQFKSGNLVQTVVSALAASQLPAHRLELEITEAVLIRDDEAVLAILHRLRGLGVQIALDDFGMGYSSLSYLQRFPFDKIKIDRTFIKDVACSDDSRAIVQAVVSIATQRNITTTAEGVETEQQMQWLRTLGCTEMQGFLFSPPRPVAELKRLLPPCGRKCVAIA